MGGGRGFRILDSVDSISHVTMICFYPASGLRPDVRQPDVDKLHVLRFNFEYKIFIHEYSMLFLPSFAFSRC